MSEALANEPLRIFDGGEGGPYLILPVARLDRIRALLDHHHVDYWLDRSVIQFKGEPLTTFINFGRRGDAARLRSILEQEERVGGR